MEISMYSWIWMPIAGWLLCWLSVWLLISWYALTIEMTAESYTDSSGTEIQIIPSRLCTVKNQLIIICDGYFIGVLQCLSQHMAIRLAAFKNNCPRHLIHIYDDDSGSYMMCLWHLPEWRHNFCNLQIPFPGLDNLFPTYDGSHYKNIFDNIFGLVRVVRFQLDSQNSLFFVVQFYSKFISSSFGIVFIVLCSWKSIYSFWEYNHHLFGRECDNTYLYSFKCQKIGKSTFKLFCDLKTLISIFALI